MCVVSAVMDQYRPWIQPINPGWPTVPQQPTTAPYTSPSVPPTIVIKEKTFGAEEIRELIESFRQAVAAAEKFDKLTGQPDCVDPEKATLIERVEELERKLDEIAKAAGGDNTGPEPSSI